MAKKDLTKIVLIDDHKLFREGVKYILECEPSFKIVGEGDDGKVAAQLVGKHKPDVVLMDINMPEMNGIQATVNLVRDYPNTSVIILSIHDDESYVAHALKTGAKGYLLKEMSPDALVKGINIVREGGSYLHPRITHKLIQEFLRLEDGTPFERAEIVANYRKPLHLLTYRECEVLQLLAGGKSNRGVAVSLSISEKTVKNHVSNILRKMNVNDRTQAVLVAIRKGWVACL